MIYLLEPAVQDLEDLAKEVAEIKKKQRPQTPEEVEMWADRLANFFVEAEEFEPWQILARRRGLI